MSMTIPDFVEAWWISVRPTMEAAGVSGRFVRSPADRPNPSCHLVMRRNDQEIELLAWESGMADLNVLPRVGPLNMEHFDDVRSPEALGGVLMRLAAIALS